MKNDRKFKKPQRKKPDHNNLKMTRDMYTSTRQLTSENDIEVVNDTNAERWHNIKKQHVT